MENESGSDILAENLIELGFNPETSVSNNNFIIPGSDRFLNSRFVVALLPGPMYFLASDSFGTKAYTSSTYTGIYTSVALPKETACKILKRDWIDAILYFKKRKTGVKFIDEKLTIIAKGWVPTKELSIESVNLFLELNSKGNPYFMVIQQDYLPKIESLKDKMILGIETNQWIYKMEDIKYLLDIGSKVLNHIKKACN